MLVVALLLTAVSTGVSARECRAADTRNENCPKIQALRHGAGDPNRTIVAVVPAMAGRYAGTLHTSAMAQSIERIREVETI